MSVGDSWEPPNPAAAYQNTNVPDGAASIPAKEITHKKVKSIAPSTREVNAGTLFVAALFLIGITVTAVQMVVSLNLDTFQHYEWRLSTGGLLALGVGIYVSVKCRTWSEFRRRIWPWLVVAAVVSALFTIMQAVLPQDDEGPLPREPEPGLVSKWEKIDSYPEWEYVPEPTGKVLVDFSGIMLCHKDQAAPECMAALVGNYEEVCLTLPVSRDSVQYKDPETELILYNACQWRLKEIKEQQASDRSAEGWVVASSGWDKLVASPETENVRVVIKDTQTHVATCVLGFFGECE